MIFYVILLNSLTAIWLIFEIWLIIRDRIQGKGKTERDRGTRYLNFISLAAGFTTAGIISGYTKFLFSWGRTRIVYWAGFAVMLLGLSLRIWAIAILGKSFRTTVETHNDQQVVKRGPYRLVRHPSYSGLLLISLGYGIAVQNWLSLIFAIGLPLAALLYRIHIEEAALIASLGQKYAEYRRQTKRLIPWIW